jgi:hypothetical protein
MTDWVHSQIDSWGNARFKHRLQRALARIGTLNGRELRPALRDLARKK